MLEGAPQVGYLGVLYGRGAAASLGQGRAQGEEQELVLRANDVSALHVAWQYFVNGLQYPFLSHKLHPFFGVYFTPTPFEHFMLLIDWLEGQPEALAAPRARALDLGTGCGVVSFILRERRQNLEVVASDLCTNAVFSVRSEVARWGTTGVEVLESDLFSGLEGRGQFDAIVFNPPWVPRPPGEWQPSAEPLDASYEPARGAGDVTGGNDYPPELFARLFADAPRFLRPGGRLLLLFSDYAECRGLVPQSPLLGFAGGAASPLVLRGVQRRPVEAAQRDGHRLTRRDKPWVLEKEHSVELWEFAMPPS